MGREVRECGGFIGRVWLGRKGERKVGRGWRTSLRRQRKIELRSLNRMLKEKLHCIHHNELNSTSSCGREGGNRVAHSRPALRGGPYSKSWRRRESVTESCLIGSVVELFDVILALLETKLSSIQHPDFNRNIKRRESELQCAGCTERGKAATTTTSTARR